MRALLAEAADRAYQALQLLPRNRWGEVVGQGADGTPTTHIDKVAEDAIRHSLNEAEAKLNFLSEESEFADLGHELTAVVDPVDGTHNALAGLPNYSVSIAVCEADMAGARYGIVRDLTSGWSFEAAKGEGAWLNGRRIRVRPYSEEGSLFSIYLGRRAHDRAFRLAGMCRRVRSLGAASLDMCMVASGAADLYYMNTTAENLELRITDVAASCLIVREAGGEVYGLGGDALNMPLDPAYRSNMFALGDEKLLEVVL